MTETLSSYLSRGMWRKNRLGHEARTASEIISPGITSQEPKFIQGSFPLGLGGLQRKGFWGDRATKAWNSVPRRKHDHGQGQPGAGSPGQRGARKPQSLWLGKQGGVPPTNTGGWGGGMPIYLQLRVSRVFRSETACIEASMHVAPPRGEENGQSVARASDPPGLKSSLEALLGLTILSVPLACLPSPGVSVPSDMQRAFWEAVGQRQAQRERAAALDSSPPRPPWSSKNSVTRGPTPLLILGRAMPPFSCFFRAGKKSSGFPFLTGYFCP